jgi:peroxiredoxin
MKKLILILLVFEVVVGYAGQKFKKLNIGDKAVLTDLKMADVSGSTVSLNDFKGENGLLVIFSCNNCPFVLRWEGRYPELKKVAGENGLGMIVINSNDQKRSGDDSFEAMKEHAKAKGYNFSYLVDEESRIANAFGGQTTPHAFIFDKNWRLVYKGAIDDNAEKASEVKRAFVKEALKSLGKEKEVALPETLPQGCSIKRKLN